MRTTASDPTFLEQLGNALWLEIDAAQQQMTVRQDAQILACYPVATAKNGLGETMGSGCTPRGWHKIRAKIGAGQPLYSVFRGRRPTGEIYSPELGRQYPERDWILTRILWLSGLEPGVNRYGVVDTAWRYIYIHGCPEEVFRAAPSSHGCIRMRNQALLELFTHTPQGTWVWIHG
ncbi:MAG: L,D-transpeptidase [Methylococcales bacterium]|nr:L,D-transpeptidase [Methylococcales bacterium]